MTAGRAALTHGAALEHLLGPDRVLFKKIDSTLRGQPAAETAATLAFLKVHFGRAFGVFAPAFPTTGRTTVDGHIHVAGRPLEEAEVWQRDHSYASADLLEVLASADVAAEHVPLAVIRSGGDALRAALDVIAARGEIVAVCDAETDDDLRRIAEASLPAPAGTFFIGSAGLAHALAASMPGEAMEPPRFAASTQGALMVVGSLAVASRTGARKLVAGGDVVHVPVEPATLLGAPEGRIELGRQVAGLLDAGEDVLVEIRMDDAPDMSLGPRLVEGLAEALAAGGFADERLRRDRRRDRLRPALQLRRQRHPPDRRDRARRRARPDARQARNPGRDQGRRLRRRGQPRPHRRPAPGHPRQRHDSQERNPGMSGSTTGLPTIAITMGDPAGIGPEVIMKALAHDEVHAICQPLVIGDAARLRQAGRIVGSDLAVEALDSAADAHFSSRAVQCVDLKLVPPDLPFGRVSAIAGEAAYRYIEKAVEVTKAGLADAICTAPISKEALHAAGRKYPGHTELLAYLTGTPEVSMMLVSPKLRVIHVTTHIGLIDAIAKIEPGLVERVITRGHDVLVKAGIANPKIGVCAINPHAGENGLFGHGEEAEKITPAVEACRGQGLGRARAAAGRHPVLSRRPRRL